MSNLLRRLVGESTIWKSAHLLPKRDRQKVVAVIILQISFGLLDLLGIAIIGMLGALTINGVQSQQPGNRVSAVLSFLNIENLSFQNQVFILGVAAAIILIGKTIFSIIFLRKITFFLSRRAAVISADLVSRLFSKSLLTIQSKPMYETMYAVTGGVSLVTVGVLGTLIALISDISLLLVVGGGLFFVDPKIAFGNLLVFGMIGYLLYRLMHIKAKRLGKESSEIGIKSQERITEVLSSYREIVVRNRRDYYSREIGRTRLQIANANAELAFMPNISKYVMEVTIVIGALAMSAVSFTSSDTTRSVAVLSVFFAASTRIGPAVLRIQQGAVSIKTALGGAGPTIELVELLRNARPIKNVSDVVSTDYIGFLPEINISNVSFSYPAKKMPAINEVSLTINQGEIIALVGPSGAGKTTIVDILLGVLTPDSGHVTLSGLPPLDCIEKWPGAISYVPQDVIITNGTIRENVAMGYPISEASDDLVWSALKIAQLDDFVKTLEKGLDTSVGDRGTRISGGQRQRLGIARAMFTKPLLLVLDEATSSLDGETEANISGAIQNMRGSVTVLMIAHRLSTVRDADKVIYLDDGKVLAAGSFDEVRKANPVFDGQASLMGL